ncbi:MAG: hypothetical protein AAB522_02485 [Patescibacteria group bacterium]
MNITIEKVEPIEKAFERLKNAALEVTNGENILIYQNATMRVSDFFPKELNLTSLYVLKNQLDFIKRLRDYLQNRYQIDILNLSSILHLKTEDGKIIGMAPPVVEIYQETVQIIPLPQDKNPPEKSLVQVAILKDGVHRGFVANEKNELMRCIVIHGALSEHMPYAYPNEWSKVKIFEAKPEQKKFYRRQNPYTFMRPLKALRQTSDTPPPPEWGR